MLIVQPVGSGAARYYFEGSSSGRWLGDASTELRLAGSVSEADLTAVLRGCHPGDGAFLPARRVSRRRAGWDLILAAPKSLSLVAALAPDVASAAAMAHRDSVEGVFDHLEQRVLSTRRSGARTRVAGALGAVFDHRENAAGEPHLHSHVILVNLAYGDSGTWGPLAGGWWTERRSLGAMYQLALRRNLGLAGWHFGWQLHGDGLADVAGVPRAALRATSSRRLAIAADAAGFSLAQDDAGAGVRRGAQQRSRSHPAIRPWREHAAAAGLPPEQADRLARDAQGPAATDDAGTLETRVTGWLAARRSSFRHSDVVVALAACSPDGMGIGEANDWAHRFCSEGLRRKAPGRAPAPRWTTSLARSADDRLREIALKDPGAVSVIGSPPGRSSLLAHAAHLEGAAPGWTRDGVRMAILSPSSGAAMRWETLTAMPATTRHVGREQVLVVDQADRLPTPGLVELLDAALGRGARVILVEGGTAPRLSWCASDGFVEVGDRLGRVDPGPAPRWSPATPGPAGDILSFWWEATRAGSRPVMVGLGPAEVDGLNQAARALLRGRDAPAAFFEPGDLVVALRRAGAVRARETGTVLAADPDRKLVQVSWNGSGVSLLERGEVACLGYGYAATPTVVAGMEGPLVVLGPKEALGRDRWRVAHHAVARAGVEHDRALERGAGLGL